MRLLDTNVWLAAALSGHNHHRTVQEWLQGETTSASLHFCRSSQQSFLRLLTTAAVLRPFGIPPLTNSEAWRVYQGFLEDPRITLALEPADLELAWRRLSAQPTSSPKTWMDAYLVAFAVSGGYQLVTIDAAFKAYEGLDMLLLSHQ